MGSACQGMRVELEKSLAQHVIELAHVELVYDGQALTCKNISCARARLATAGGVLALMGESTCLSQGLQYTLNVVTLNPTHAPLVYKKSMKLTHKHYAAEGGRILAKKVLKGPKLPRTISREAQLNLWSVGLGTVWPQQGRYYDYGMYFNVSRFRRLSEESPIEIRFGMSYSLTEADDFEVNTSGLEVGLTYSPRSDGLGLWLSGGVMGAYHRWSLIKREVRALDQDELFVGSKRRRDEGDTFGVAPWLEAGWIWSRGHLQPYIASRYVPLGLPLEQEWAEWSFLFGLRWR